MSGDCIPTEEGERPGESHVMGTMPLAESEKVGRERGGLADPGCPHHRDKARSAVNGNDLQVSRAERVPRPSRPLGSRSMLLRLSIPVSADVVTSLAVEATCVWRKAMLT